MEGAVDLEGFERAAKTLGLNVSRETGAKLSMLVDNLQRWQKAINLVGRASLEEVWTRHILDSAQLVPLLPAGNASVADLGSGGGFPGLVLAAFRPELDWTLIEADARKAAFLSETGRKMLPERPPRIVISRIEEAAPVKAAVITARALAPLSKLLIWAERHRSENAICLFHKGKGWQLELTEAMKRWDIHSQPLTSVTDRDAVILRIGSYHPTGLRDRQPEGRRRQNDDGD